jgi:hypothetical protein
MVLLFRAAKKDIGNTSYVMTYGSSIDILSTILINISTPVVLCLSTFYRHSIDIQLITLRVI